MNAQIIEIDDGGSRVIWKSGLLKRYDVSRMTLYRWLQAGKIPGPDVRIEDREGWYLSTIVNFERESAGKAAHQ